MFGTSYPTALERPKLTASPRILARDSEVVYINIVYMDMLDMYIYIYFCIQLLMSQYLKVSEIELILRLQLELRNQAVVSLALMNHHLNKGQFQIMHMDMCGATM